LTQAPQTLDRRAPENDTPPAPGVSIAAAVPPRVLEIILLRRSRIQYNAALANLTPVHFIGALLCARRVRARIYVFADALGGLFFGFDTVVICGTTQALSALFHLTPFALGLTVSGALVGTIIGSMLAGIPGDAYGRRDSLRILRSE
jgi:hypothetical protein